MKKNNTNSKKASKWISIKHEKKVKIWVVSYSVLVNDVDDDDELPIFLAVVDESNPPDLNVPLERLNMERRKRKFFRLEIENYKEKKKKKKKKSGAQKRGRGITIFGLNCREAETVDGWVVEHYLGFEDCNFGCFIKEPRIHVKMGLRTYSLPRKHRPQCIRQAQT